MQPPPARAPFLPLLGGVVVLAWVALGLWESSPWGRYLNHAELGGADLAAGGAAWLGQAGLYVAGWVLMTSAMMLPTTVPLLDAFHRLTAARADRGRLLSLLVLGYLAVWLAFGVLAHGFDLGLHEAFEHSRLLQDNVWLFGAGPLLLAGAYQFSRLKYRCLDRCRAPAGFIFQHWRGGNAARQAALIGAHHGLFCVGCCWALMLLMFAVGTGNIAWMLALGALMAIEKNLAWGRRISTPLGVGLIAWALAIAVEHSWSWQ